MAGELQQLIKKAEEIIKKGEGLSKEAKVKLLGDVSKIRSEIMKTMRKLSDSEKSELKKIMSKLGKTYPPYLYRLRKK